MRTVAEILHPHSDLAVGTVVAALRMALDRAAEELAPPVRDEVRTALRELADEAVAHMAERFADPVGSVLRYPEPPPQW